MTGDEFHTIMGLLTPMAADVAEVKSDLRNHIDRSDESNAARAQTCPHAQAISRLQADIDSVAGVQRSREADYKVLTTWHADEMQKNIVEGAVWKERISPFKKTWEAVMAVMKPVVIAVAVTLTLIYFGIK